MNIAASYWYLATPYSKFPGGHGAAYVEACNQTALLIKAGIRVFSPIAHTHGVAVHGDIDGTSDNAVWHWLDEPFVQYAVGLIVCMLPGYEISAGVTAEVLAFRKTTKPIIFMMPDVVPFALLHRGTQD